VNGTARMKGKVRKRGGTEIKEEAEKEQNFWTACGTEGEEA